jgi:lysophospholipase L1-like esterase
MPRRRPRTPIAVGLVLILAALVGACNTPPPDDGTEGPPLVISNDWWAAGDSIFSGSSNYYGTPAQLEGVSNVAWGGLTVTKTSILGTPQPTIREHLERMVNTHGVPDNVILHAGGADLVARVAWSADFTVDDFVADAVALDTWLRELGTEVWWSSITPVANWTPVARANSMRLLLNEALQTAFGERFIDCEADLLGPNSAWLRQEYQVPLDGAHLNDVGARVHARCLAPRLGLQLKG